MIVQEGDIIRSAMHGYQESLIEKGFQFCEKDILPVHGLLNNYQTILDENDNFINAFYEVILRQKRKGISTIINGFNLMNRKIDYFLEVEDLFFVYLHFNKIETIKERLNELKIKLDELGEETYCSFISENRCKEIATLVQDESNDEAYLKLIDVIIVNEDGSITIIDNNGLPLFKEEVSSHIKQLNSLTEFIHGYYSSPLSGRAYRYKVVRLEEKPWKK